MRPGRSADRSPRSGVGAAPGGSPAASFDFAPARRARRPSLTPLVDVVFLLLVFFMLAARFGPEHAVPLAAGGFGPGAWEGPPRLVSVRPEGVALNGVPVALEDLAGILAPLMPASDAPVVVRPETGADVQALVDALATLAAAGYAHLVVIE
jgi:biopolymer transport protein ExbD